jgi:hypothetical protein
MKDMPIVAINMLLCRRALEGLHQDLADGAVTPKVLVDLRARHPAQPGDLGDGELRDRQVAAMHAQRNRDASFFW